MAAEARRRRGRHVYDAMPSSARKFLMAGRGGLNLTQREPSTRCFLAATASRRAALGPLSRRSRPIALRAWAEGLGQPTLVGSSGRVFPAWKASPLLRAWLRRLGGPASRSAPRHAGRVRDGGALVFESPTARRLLEPDATVLALGGASWPRLGSDGGWAPVSSGRHRRRAAPARERGLRVAWSRPCPDPLRRARR